MDQVQQWIRQIQRKSSRTAANQLVAHFYKELYAYVYRQTLDKELSLDMTQDIFVSLLQTIHNYDVGKASFKTWLYKIATHRIVDYYRSKSYKHHQSVVPLDDSLLCEPGDLTDFTETVERRQDLEKILSFVNQCDSLSQQIFRLKLFAEYTFAEIAHLLQVPESTVKTKYYALIKKIKAVLQGELSWTNMP